MGAFSTALLGAAIGLAACWLRPLILKEDRTGSGSRLRLLATCVAGALAAVGIKYAGDFVGVFSDGQSIEWLASVLAAVLATTLCAAPRRLTGESP
jgi:hypothetical protein